MKIITLSEEFYKEHANCHEILQKKDRPYACMEITVGTTRFAIPFRHHISHSYSYHTIGDAGLDFSKSVIINEQEYDDSTLAIVDNDEFAIVKRDENKIKYKFRQYLNQYKKALKRQDVPRNARLVQYSALQYFEDLL